MIGLNMAEKLWDLSNILTGFAVAQALAATFALTKVEWKMVDTDEAHRFAKLGTVGFTVFYVAAIGLTCYVGCGRDTGNTAIWLGSFIARSVAVLIFNGVALYTLEQHNKFVNRPPRPQPAKSSV